MALSDIPEFVPATSGDLIRAADWNRTQQMARNAVRSHHHTVAPGTANDASTSDDAQQIGSGEIATGAVLTAALADGAVTTAKLAASSVGTANLQDNAVTAVKLAFATVNSGSTTIEPQASQSMPVQMGATNTKTTVYFPVLLVMSVTGNSACDIDAQITYQKAVTNPAATNDVYIRLRNQGTASAVVIWKVLIFA